MSMTIAQQSPATSWQFDEDTGNGSLVSMTGLSGTSFGNYAPGVVEVKSASSVSRNKVVRANIAVRVPIVDLMTPSDNAWSPNDAVKGKARAGYLQVALTVTCPNLAGIIGSTDNTAGVPNTQSAANLAALTEALSIMLNLIGNQSDGVLASGKALVLPSYASGMFDSSNPIARGMAGIIPVDPNANRAIKQALS